jgi:predicted ribosome quality control (RQC) complex YloA/Tae2 family protein
MLTVVADEELIKYGWEEDVWFHVDNLSSAHIYVRLPEGENWENISQDLLTDCAQLTKANSIEGMLVFFRLGSLCERV